ncbi:hypothetical protein L218DRAFT_452401 [Marasmius fiardii PR-910]|nr:hypothetical protein L218DRAFT_452401 [Marasmius fiardii PR-910]
MPQRKPDRAIIIVSGYGTIKVKVGDMREDKKRRDSKEKEILQVRSCEDSWELATDLGMARYTLPLKKNEA